MYDHALLILKHFVTLAQQYCLARVTKLPSLDPRPPHPQRHSMGYMKLLMNDGDILTCYWVFEFEEGDDVEAEDSGAQQSEEASR